MAESSKAVFLSYAKQDSDAAARICEALRTAGIEVWFDQSELRGGDVWDAAIRKQIKTCALLIPIISVNTQARAEGYFRLEWKLAVDRSHLMSPDRTFLLPVVIDQTSESDERVPERFREIQWTYLPAGETSPAFVARLQRLLAPDSRAAPPVRPTPQESAPGLKSTPAAGGAPLPIGGSKGFLRRPAAWIGMAAAIAAIGIGVWALQHRWSQAAPVVAYSSEDRRMSFAVLPFQAPADDPHALQIAKATANELLTMLETNPQFLTVVSPASVEQATAHEGSIKKIAKALDVHFLIRGTVARSGDAYTVTVFSVDGNSERVLTSEILTVAANALTPRWRDDVEDAFFHLVRPALDVEVKRARDKPVDALDVRDLTFRAWVDWRKEREADGKGAYSNANELLTRALAEAPDDPYALEVTAIINLCDCINAWSANPEKQKAIGAAALDKYLRIDPKSEEMLTEKAGLDQLRGRFEESLVIADTILGREPENSSAIWLKAKGLLRLGRLKEAQALADQLEARYPNSWAGAAALSADIYYSLGDYAHAAQLAGNATAKMSQLSLHNPVMGSIRLTQIAAEARIGNMSRAKTAFADFTSVMPEVTTISAIRKWIHPSADLANYEPLYEGLRMAGVSE
jgi:TolB-like protein